MRFYKTFLIVLSISLPFIIQGCSESSPVDEKTLVRVYAEMVIMQDSSKLNDLEIQKKVLTDFNISASDYEKSVNILREKPERWQDFYDSVIVYLQKLEPIPKPSDEKVLPKRPLSLEKKIL